MDNVTNCFEGSTYRTVCYPDPKRGGWTVFRVKPADRKAAPELLGNFRERQAALWVAKEWARR